jgi:anti-sigma B factor antagonist
VNSRRRDAREDFFGPGGPVLLYAGYELTDMVLQVETKRLPGGITVLALTGRMTLGRESQQIESTVGELLRQGEKKLIFDLFGVDYVDSSGIGIIAHSTAVARQAGGGLHVAGATGKVLHVFRAMRLEMIVPSYPTVEAAVEAFTSA